MCRYVINLAIKYILYFLSRDVETLLTANKLERIDFRMMATTPKIS